MSNGELQGLWVALGLLLGLGTLPGTVELLLLTLGALLPLRRPPAPEGETPLRVVAVVPAHNEEKGIGHCVASLRACRGSDRAFAVVVVADNCTDATAAEAARAGARVLVRRDENLRGKGYALDFAFRQLLAEDPEVLLVVDADSSVDIELLNEVRRHFAAGADALQVAYRVANPQASVRTRLMNVALLAFNVLRPRGRHALGLSAGILGNGFALSRETLISVPYEASSVVEDLEYHLRLIRAGRRVRFAPQVAVWGEMPAGGSGARTQRARWEGGRLRLLAEAGPRLAVGLLGGEFRFLEPLLDLLLLPLAFHVLGLLAMLALPLDTARTVAGVGLAVVGLHIVVAVWKGGGGWRDLAVLAAAPAYILWKAALVPVLFRTARKDAAWVRTERSTEGERREP